MLGTVLRLMLMMGCAASPAMAADTSVGEALFSRYCATCHGKGAQGDGPTAAIVSVHPTDLTLLSASNGGTFPVTRVVRRIDGRDTVIAHGSPMPIYGAFFEGRPVVPVETDGDPIKASLPVIEIVEYLRALQAE